MRTSEYITECFLFEITLQNKMQLYKREAEESIQNKFAKEIRPSSCSLRETGEEC